MDKPMSMSVKDYLIRMMAVKMMVSEKTIEAVVDHQFQSANQALQENDSVEISGFGKFLFNRKKAEKLMEKMLSKKAMFEKQMNNESLSEHKRMSAANKLANTLESIETLKPRIYEVQRDLRGVEEQADSSRTYEGADRGSEQGENDDLRELSLPLGSETQEGGV